MTEIKDREELKSLPVGLYVIPSEDRIAHEFLDVRFLDIRRDVAVRTIARIVDEMPRGLSDGMGIEVSVRPDGKVILIGAGAADKLAEAADKLAND